MTSAARRDATPGLGGGRALRGLLGLTLAAACGCGVQVAPLDAPVPDSHAVRPAAWVVLTNQDLQQVPFAVRLAAGKSVEVSVPPLKLGEQSLAATTLTASVAEGAASITADQDVALTFPITSPDLSLALVADGRAACPLTWQAKGATLSLALHVGRGTDGAVEIVLAGTPSLNVGTDSLKDVGGCLAEVSDQAKIAAHVRDAAAAALSTPYVNAARAALKAVIPPTLELAASLSVDIEGHPVSAQLETRLRPPSSAPVPEGGSLIQHNGSYAAIGLDIALNVGRHPCAMDAPPPALQVQQLPVKAPDPTTGGQVLRRALVLDRASLAHISWATTRSGYLCRGVSRGVEKLLTASWAADAVPALGTLVEPGSVGARFWPGSTPTVRVVDVDAGAGLEWQLPDAVLEVSAPVAGVELVVLRVEGSFRLTLKPTINAGIGLQVVSAAVDSAVLSSPLLPQANMSAGSGLAPAVDAALRGIFAGVLGLGSGAVGDAVVVGSTRVGDHMWLWLEGGALPGLAEAGF